MNWFTEKWICECTDLHCHSPMILFKQKLSFFERCTFAGRRIVSKNCVGSIPRNWHEVSSGDDYIIYEEGTMEEYADNMYTDGTLACEIEHFLVMWLHELNTVGEIEQLKERIHQMMTDTFGNGEGRE